MALLLTMKKNDLEPKFRVTLQNADGTAIDLSLATSVRFIMKQSSGGTKLVSAPAAFLDRANGVVEYTWASGDTDTVGPFQAEFEVIWPTGRPMTVPNGEYLVVNVVPDLG